MSDYDTDTPQRSLEELAQIATDALVWILTDSHSTPALAQRAAATLLRYVTTERKRQDQAPEEIPPEDVEPFDKTSLHEAIRRTWTEHHLAMEELRERASADRACARAMYLKEYSDTHGPEAPLPDMSSMPEGLRQASPLDTTSEHDPPVAFAPSQAPDAESATIPAPP